MPRHLVIHRSPMSATLLSWNSKSKEIQHVITVHPAAQHLNPSHEL
jgi:hypothetical protein